jgi:hypothetical protein
MAEITGGCLCGKVRWKATAAPMFQGVCHCTDCQRQGGTAFSVLLAFPDNELTITGPMADYRSKGSSGNDVVRRFCPSCGSPIVSMPTTNPGMSFIKAGTLDDTGILDPKVHIWCDSRQPWVKLPEDAITFPKSPN